MSTNAEYLSCNKVEALGYFQLLDIRYNNRNVVTERVSTKVLGHSSQIQQGSRIDVLKSSSNFYHLFLSMREIFPAYFSSIAQFGLTLWLLKVLEIACKISGL